MFVRYLVKTSRLLCLSLFEFLNSLFAYKTVCHETNSVDVPAACF
jgi:hypothetical protein